MQFGMTIAAAVCALLGLAGAAYFALCVWAAGRFRRRCAVARRFRAAGQHPEVAQGPRSATCMRRFAAIACFDYGEYELLFGVSDPNEPALELVTRLQQEFPRPQLSAWCSVRWSWE